MRRDVRAMPNPVLVERLTTRQPWPFGPSLVTTDVVKRPWWLIRRTVVPPNTPWTTRTELTTGGRRRVTKTLVKRPWRWIRRIVVPPNGPCTTLVVTVSAAAGSELTGIEKVRQAKLAMAMISFFIGMLLQTGVIAVTSTYAIPDERSVTALFFRPFSPRKSSAGCPEE
jgi:hypothetical protein